MVAVLEYNGVTDTGTHATLFTVMGSHHLTQDSAGRPTLSLKLMVDAAFRMTVASARVTAAEMAAAQLFAPLLLRGWRLPMEQCSQPLSSAARSP